MKQPTISEFDGWKDSPVGQWYFRTYLAEYARKVAEEAGRSIGMMGETFDTDYMYHAKEAGRVDGIEAVVSGITEENPLLDPFEAEREELADDSTGEGDRSPTSDTDGL